jgi:hypothetical protein
MKRGAFIIRKSSLSSSFIKIMIFYENVFIAENRKATGAKTAETICLMGMSMLTEFMGKKCFSVQRSLKNP